MHGGTAQREEAHLQALPAGALVSVKLLQRLEPPALLAEPDLQRSGGQQQGTVWCADRLERRTFHGLRCLWGAKQRRWQRRALGGGMAHLLPVPDDVGDFEVLLTHLGRQAGEDRQMAGQG